MSGGRLTGRDGFGFILVWPVVEGRGEPGTACFAAGRLGGILHMDRPQIGVLLVVLGPVGDEAALHVRSVGRPKQRILSKSEPTELESAQRNSATKLREKERKREGERTVGGGLARLYGSLPNCQSSGSWQLAR